MNHLCLVFFNFLGLFWFPVNGRKNIDKKGQKILKFNKLKERIKWKKILNFFIYTSTFCFNSTNTNYSCFLFFLFSFYHWSEGLVFQYLDFFPSHWNKGFVSGFWISFVVLTLSWFWSVFVIQWNHDNCSLLSHVIWVASSVKDKLKGGHIFLFYYWLVRPLIAFSFLIDGSCC